MTVDDQWSAAAAAVSTLPLPPDASLCELSARDFCAIEAGSVILLRHGESDWNDKNLFTGWHDVPLSKAGEAQAVGAGDVLAAHGICFDRVFVSNLKRTVKTAWLVLERMDDFAVPIEISWRLNERHYGALTGRDKAETRRALGEQGFEALRREPPPVEEASCFDAAGRASFRSVPPGQVPRKESFEDTRQRVAPLWREEILPASRAPGGTVLVISSKNLLRALLMELTDLPPDALIDLDVPNGQPIVYDVATRRLTLLGRDGASSPWPPPWRLRTRSQQLVAQLADGFRLRALPLAAPLSRLFRSNATVSR